MIDNRKHLFELDYCIELNHLVIRLGLYLYLPHLY